MMIMKKINLSNADMKMYLNSNILSFSTDEGHVTQKVNYYTDKKRPRDLYSHIQASAFDLYEGSYC